MIERPLTKETFWKVDYYFSVGKMGSKFLTDLRDNELITGLKCGKCNTVYVPPRSVCPKCYSQIGEWVQVSNKGTITSYTVVNYIYSEYYQPWKVPYTIGIIQLDGASTGLCHLIDVDDPSKLKVGMRVQAVFKPKEQREGSILDIKCFTPIA